MALRLEYRDVAPDAVRALAGLNTYSDSCAVPQGLRRLVEVLVSRFNGCSYCIAVHERQARGLGESPKRLAALPNWRAVEAFSEAEKAAFAWAEAVTDISRSDGLDGLYRDLSAHYAEAEIVDLTFVVLSMNAWNRLAIAFGREAGEN